MNSDEEATLYRQIPEEDAPPFVQKIWSGPMKDVLVMARQGHEGPIEHMLIKTIDGQEYLGKEIYELARLAATSH